MSRNTLSTLWISVLAAACYDNPFLQQTLERLKWQTLTWLQQKKKSWWKTWWNLQETSLLQGWRFYFNRTKIRNRPTKLHRTVIQCLWLCSLWEGFKIRMVLNNWGIQFLKSSQFLLTTDFPQRALQSVTLKLILRLHAAKGTIINALR